MSRLVSPELLDTLDPSDPAAIRSRKDLQRLNFLMRNANIMARLLGKNPRLSSAPALVEVGAGDGNFLLRVIRQLDVKPARAKLVVVDRQPTVSPASATEFKRLGWELEIVSADVFDWLLRNRVEKGAVLVANLFLHHFQDQELQELLRLIAQRADFFAACEPRRSREASIASRFVGLIGCNAVTRHDAVVSVRAGFRERELSKLWPAEGDWNTEEGNRGLFSHYFVAARRSQPG